MKKGFTLIELLAVIVILAIIALIATPIIMNVIDDAKKQAFKNSAYGIIEAAQLSNSMDILHGKYQALIFTYDENGESSNVEGKKLEYKGKRPQSGQVHVRIDGKVAIAIHDGKYCAEKGFEDEEVVVTEKDKNECFL
jgi:type IV pilus assembly protein PilA